MAKTASNSSKAKKKTIGTTAADAEPENSKAGNERRPMKSDPAPSSSSSAKAAESPSRKGRKRPAVHKSKSPSQVPIVLAYLAIILALTALSGFNVLPDQAVMLIAGGVTILFTIAVPVYQVYFKLKHKLIRIILAAAIPLWALGGAYVLYTSVVYPKPAYQVDMTRAEREVTFALPGGFYDVRVSGKFPEPSESKTTETAKKKKASPTHQNKGSFVVTVSDANSVQAKSETFKGFLESITTRQRITKKGSALVTKEALSRMFNYHSKGDGPLKLTLTNLEDKLAEPLTVTIYPKSFLFIPVLLLGLLAVCAFTFVDFLMKAAREYSLFAMSMASAFGFVGYFKLLSEPGVQPSTMAMTVVVGALIGIAIAVALDYALKKPFQDLNRKWRISL